MRRPKEILSNEQAWDLASNKYAQPEELQHDIELLRNGGSTLLPTEVAEIGDLSGMELAVHLCCSHGSDALSLLQLGVKSIAGVDISQDMLSLAQQKTDALQADATWLHDDVMTPQPTLKGQADLVYTGRGGLPWVRDLDTWATLVADMLKPGGRLYIFEGHPLNWVWSRDAPRWNVIRSYFNRQPQANADFPAMAVEQYSEDGADAPTAWEWQWTIGDTVSAVTKAGLRITSLAEHPFNFWPLFDELDDQQDGLVPQCFSLMAMKD